MTWLGSVSLSALFPSPQQNHTEMLSSRSSAAFALLRTSFQSLSHPRLSHFLVMSVMILRRRFCCLRLHHYRNFLSERRFLETRF